MHGFLDLRIHPENGIFIASSVYAGYRCDQLADHATPSVAVDRISAMRATPSKTGHFAAKCIFVHFKHRFAPFRLLDDEYFFCVYCPSKESFLDIFMTHCPGKKTLEHTIWQPFGGEM